MVRKNYCKELKSQNSEGRVTKFVEGKWYSGRAKVYYTKNIWPKRSYWCNQSLWRDYKYNKVQGNTTTDAEKFENIEGLSRSTYNFKIGFYKCLKTFPALKNSILSLHIIRNRFKRIKTVCKGNEDLFF